MYRLFSAILLITGVTIGAGMLGLPYVFAPLGIVTTVLFIVGLGLVMLALNLMIGEVAFALKKPLQLPGLAREILGAGAQRLLSVIIIVSWIGSLLAYIVGEGQVLSGLFGGSAVVWSCMFWLVASICILLGFKTVARTSRLVSLFVIALLVGISIYALFHASVHQVAMVSGSSGMVAAFGVALFALHGAPAIVEAHELLKNDRRRFRQALVGGTIIPVVVYILFTIAVVGVTGSSTTPVATVGLGARLGGRVAILGALTGIGAMFSCYLGIGTALRETLAWDNRFPWVVALGVPLVVPIGLFVLGIRDFSGIMGVIGGVCIASEAIVMVAVYVRAAHQGVLKKRGFWTRHPWLIGVPVAFIFLVGALESLISR